MNPLAPVPQNGQTHSNNLSATAKTIKTSHTCISIIQVKKLILNKIEQYDLVAPIVQGSFQWVIMMGIEHERIHLETSAVIISQVRTTGSGNHWFC